MDFTTSDFNRVRRSSSISPPICYGDFLPLNNNFRSSSTNSQTLRACMEKHNMLDDHSRRELRQKALTLVYKECMQWLSDCLNNNSDAGGQLVLHGSYALDSHLRTSDIDAIFVGPACVPRQSFMVDMPWRLQNMKNDEGKSVASNIMPIHAARFPILKFRMFDAIDIDLQYCACAAQRQVPVSIRNVWTQRDLRLTYRDDAVAIPVINSLMYMIANNGCGVEQAEFSLALRAVKVWAQKQGIYGSWRARPGCLSCLSFTILLVYTVLAGGGDGEGRRDAVSLMRQMFKLFGAEWPWPQPVFLPCILGRAQAPELADYSRIQRQLTLQSACGQLPLSFGLMPIMTPMCVYNAPVDVIASPLDWLKITTAMKAAYEQLSDVSSTKADDGGEVNWEKFFGL